MNLLWEQFVYVSLKKYAYGLTIKSQTGKPFWKPEKGNITRIRPDILVYDGPKCLKVLDTKWKNLNGHNASPEDLRQMYVYGRYFEAESSALIYPGKGERREGVLYDPAGSYKGTS